MARLGFSIGRALNLGTKFAVGAGAFDSIGGGAGGDLLKTAGDIVGGGSRAGAGATLSERLRGGLSAVSPQFAQAENIKSAIASRKAGDVSRGITDEINESKLADIRQNAIDKETPFDPAGLLPDELKGVPRITEGIMNLIKPADADGSGDVSVAEWKVFQEKANADGSMQKSIANFMGEQAEMTGVNIKTLTTNMQPLLDKMNTTADGMVLTPGGDEFTSLDDVREMLKDPQMAASVDKKLAEQVMAIDKMQAQQDLLTRGKNQAIASMSTQQALQVAQTKKLEREAAELGGKRFESTKTLETFARGMFQHEDGTPKSIAELTTSEIDQVIRRKLKEDPLKLKQTMDLRKEFNAIDSIKQFDATETRFNQITGMLEATVSGDLKTRNTVDQVLINNFNKMMDESSVVRESEYARTPEGISLINRMKGSFQQKITGGSGLTDEDRQDIQKAAEILQKQWLVTARKKAGEYVNIAEAQGTDPALIVTNPTLRGGEVDEGNVDAFFNNPGGE